MSFFLAFAVREDQCTSLSAKVAAIAEKHGFAVHHGDQAIGAYSEGVRAFSSHFGLQCVGVIAASGIKNSVSEAWQIADALITSTSGPAREKALSFLEAMAIELEATGDAAIFMASEEWKEKERVLLYEGNASFFVGLMKQALGWKPPYYYVDAGLFADSDSDTMPIIMRFSKNGDTTRLR